MTTSKKKLIIVVGPTGSGKTELGIRLAHHYSAPIVSADSRQIYRDMSIGTAQPDRGQLAEAEHYFIASHDITEDFNCGAYEVQALALLERLFATNDTVVAVGGSGLYIKALCEGMDDLPQADEELRSAISARLADKGLKAMANELETLDPAYYAQADMSNPARVMRALEVCLQTGLPYSSFRSGERRERDFAIVKIGVDMDREDLYARINRRVDMMIETGLEAEARRLFEYRHLNSLQTVGYKELFDYFDDKCTLTEAVELIKRNSRRYAKRQLTWFRRDLEVRWFGPDDTEGITAYIDITL